MVIAGIPCEEIRHTRAVQDWLAEGRQLNRRCGPLSEATTARIQSLPLEQLEDLAEALLDFQGPDDLTAVAARKDVTLWKRFMPPLPRLLGGLFAGLLMVH